MTSAPAATIDPAPTVTPLQMMHRAPSQQPSPMVITTASVPLTVLVDVLTVHDTGVPVAAVMNFYWRDEVIPYYGGGTAAARGCHANDFMYWEVMRHAAARGFRVFDFGRSKVGTGAFSFKKNWGFAPQPLAYRFRLADGAAIPDHNPLNPKYRLFIAAWKRLPLPLANLIGPHIVRGVG